MLSVLTDSVQPEGDVKDLRRRGPELAKGWGQIATPLGIATAGGTQRINCANTEGLGGRIAGDARIALQAKTGTPVLSKRNYLPVTKSLGS